LVGEGSYGEARVNLSTHFHFFEDTELEIELLKRKYQDMNKREILRKMKVQGECVCKAGEI